MAPKLRVCHVITQLELGGAQRNTLYTLTHLNREEFEPSLFCGQGGMLDPEATAGQWETFFLRSLVRPIRPIADLSALLSLYNFFRRRRPHIVHTHSSKAGILGRLAAYLAGVPVIIHSIHGFGFTPRQNKWVRGLYVLLERFCSFISTHLVFVSKDNQSEAQELGFLQRTDCTLIRSGIVMNLPYSRATLPSEIPANAWIVTTVGNFKPQKNPEDLLDVAASVLEKDPDVHFLLIGDGERRESCEKKAKERRLENNVHFLGWRSDARQILAQSDAFLLTSLWEGLPRALVEAFAEKKPAVAYAVNGVKDILKDGETGFAVEAKDFQKAAEQLLWLKSHPREAHRMGMAGRRLVEEEFDIDRMVRDQETLYRKLVDEIPIKDAYLRQWDKPVQAR